MSEQGLREKILSAAASEPKGCAIHDGTMARLLPLLSALADCVGAVDTWQKSTQMFRDGQFHDDSMVLVHWSKVEDALTKLREVIK